jgi:perosamine synthetase
MIPRLRIDISWLDLMRAVGYCLGAPGPSELPLDPKSRDEALVTLSVRTAFDLWLAALQLPAGSEVLLSEVTVPHMARIVREHGLVPVAVPVDPRTLCVSAEDVRDRITPHSRVLVVAHLFGTRMPLAALGELASEHGILLVEDCAQSFTGSLARDSAVDVSLYSFGPIKTATALGGGVALVRDARVRERMQQLATAWPQQSASSYAGRVAKMGLLKLLSIPALFTLLVKAIELTGRDPDTMVGHSARGFPDAQLFAALRQRASTAMLKLLARRLANFDASSIASRIRRGQEFATTLQPPEFIAGIENPTHTFWVIPLVSPDPRAAVQQLRTSGLDASQISGLAIVEGEHAPTDHWFHQTVFVPRR